MSKMKKFATSIMLCFGLLLIQFSYIGAAGRETVTIDKSQTTAVSPSMPRPVSRYAWYTASNGVTSTMYLTVIPQVYENASWKPAGAGAYNSRIDLVKMKLRTECIQIGLFGFI